MKRLVLTAAMLLGGLARTASAQVSINFDGSGAPCTFAEAVPLTTAYNAQGITFNGNGSILNVCSNFGIAARSGPNFLAYNTGALPTERMIFATPQSYFDIFAASPFAEYQFYFGAVLQGTRYSSGQYQWSEVSFSGVYDRVNINDSSYLLLDDLTTRAAVVTPEPASLALMATGLLGVAGVVRRRRNG